MKFDRHRSPTRRKWKEWKGVNAQCLKHREIPTRVKAFTEHGKQEGGDSIIDRVSGDISTGVDVCDYSDDGSLDMLGSNCNDGGACVSNGISNGISSGVSLGLVGILLMIVVMVLMINDDGSDGGSIAYMEFSIECPKHCRDDNQQRGDIQDHGGRYVPIHDGSVRQ